MSQKSRSAPGSPHPRSPGAAAEPGADTGASATVPGAGRRLRRVANALNGSTALGLLVAGLGRARWGGTRRGLLLFEGYRLPLPAGGAFTIGEVVITRHTFAQLERRLPQVLRHEELHAWQWYSFWGLPFLPAYAGAMAWSLLRTRDRAAANFFERDAGLTDGGYLSPQQLRARRAQAGGSSPVRGKKR